MEVFDPDAQRARQLVLSGEVGCRHVDRREPWPALDEGILSHRRGLLRLPALIGPGSRVLAREGADGVNP